MDLSPSRLPIQLPRLTAPLMSSQTHHYQPIPSTSAARDYYPPLHRIARLPIQQQVPLAFRQGTGPSSIQLHQARGKTLPRLQVVPPPHSRHYYAPQNVKAARRDLGTRKGAYYHPSPVYRHPVSPTDSVSSTELYSPTSTSPNPEEMFAFHPPPLPAPAPYLQPSGGCCCHCIHSSPYHHPYPPPPTHLQHLYLAHHQRLLAISQARERELKRTPVILAPKPLPAYGVPSSSPTFLGLKEEELEADLRASSSPSTSSTSLPEVPSVTEGEQAASNRKRTQEEDRNPRVLRTTTKRARLAQPPSPSPESEPQTLRRSARLQGKK